MRIGLGTAAIGRPQYINIKSETGQKSESLDAFKAKGLELLSKAHHLGVDYFDTAPGYGMAEDLLKTWLSKSEPEGIEIATKWGYEYTANFDPNALVHERKEHSLAMLNKQWGESWQKLKHLTTLQIHSATFDTGVLKNEAILQRLAEIKESGIRIGMTSTGANQSEVLKFALDLEHQGEPLFEVFQCTFNVFDQSIAELIPDLKGRRLVIKEALANGRVFPNSNYPHYAEAYTFLRELSEKYAVGIDAVALRFCLDALPSDFVLSGASEIDHLEQNLMALDFNLDETEIHKLLSFALKPEFYWSERKELSWN